MASSLGLGSGLRSESGSSPSPFVFNTVCVCVCVCGKVKMANRRMPAYQEYWQTKTEALRPEYKDIISKYPDAAGITQRVYDILNDITLLAGCAPQEVGESETWRTIVRNAEEDRESFRQVLQGKRLFNALYGT